MKKVTLSSKEFATKDELHAVLKKKLDLPDYYGENLDALWDCLTAWIELPLTIEWIGYKDSEKTLGEYATLVLETFRDAEKEVIGFRLELR
jgi:ribonuclease inhibitor